jgi:hypothetical protein
MAYRGLGESACVIQQRGQRGVPGVRALADESVSYLGGMLIYGREHAGGALGPRKACLAGLPSQLQHNLGQISPHRGHYHKAT